MMERSTPESGRRPLDGRLYTVVVVGLRCSRRLSLTHTIYRVARAKLQERASEKDCLCLTNVVGFFFFTVNYSLIHSFAHYCKHTHSPMYECTNTHTQRETHTLCTAKHLTRRERIWDGGDRVARRILTGGGFANIKTSAGVQNDEREEL